MGTLALVIASMFAGSTVAVITMSIAAIGKRSDRRARIINRDRCDCCGNCGECDCV